jgi:RnfABCDGE-type electron transport complex G subunit
VSDAVRFPLVLGIITLCSAAGLAITYHATFDRIQYQRELKKARGLSAVFGIPLDESADAQRPWQKFSYGKAGSRKSFTVYEAAPPEGGRRLYAAEGSGQGYSSKIRLVVAAYRPQSGSEGLVIRAIHVVSQLETPGVGSRCTEQEFQEQFRHLPAAMLDLVTNAPYRDPEAPNSDDRRPAAISGATVTSNAVIAAVNQALGRIRHHLEQAASASPR